MILKIEEARKDNIGILGWFPKSECWFSMVWVDGKWLSFGGNGDFFGEIPTYWMDMPPMLSKKQL